MSRSVWKGPFVDGYLLKKADASRSSGRHEMIKIERLIERLGQLDASLHPHARLVAWARCRAEEAAAT